MISKIEPDTTIEIHDSIHDIVAKGKSGTILVLKSELIDKETKELKAKMYCSMFIRGLAGPENYKGFYKNDIPVSDFEPSHVAEYKLASN